METLWGISLNGTATAPAITDTGPPQNGVAVETDLDTLDLTDEKIDARDAEASTADPSRFRPWADALDALRSRRP